MGAVPEDWRAAPEEASWLSCPSVPLVSKGGEPITRLVVLRPGRRMSLEEVDFLEGLAHQATLAMENAFQHARAVAFERVKQDLAAARTIQQSLLAAKMPERDGFAFSSRAMTCYEVGGDYLDVVELEPGTCVLVMADVAGKGLASAIVAASFRSAFRAAVRGGLGLAELAGQLGDLHYGEGEEARRRYVTAVFAKLDMERKQVEVVNAGHPPLLFHRGDGRLVRYEASGPPLGMLPGMRYDVERRALEAGDSLFLFTDGLTEVFRGDEEFGLERLEAEFVEGSGLEPDSWLGKIYASLEAFSGCGGLVDDRTALIVKFAGEGAK
jgi:serine phosphatase RsbU (regulator of sigma subunit)